MKRYLRKNKDGKKKSGAYSIRLHIAPDSISKAKAVYIGLNTCQLKEAVTRAGELVSLAHFCELAFLDTLKKELPPAVRR